MKKLIQKVRDFFRKLRGKERVQEPPPASITWSTTFVVTPMPPPYSPPPFIPPELPPREVPPPPPSFPPIHHLPPAEPPIGYPPPPAGARDPFEGPFYGPVDIFTLSDDDKFAVVAASHKPGCGSLPYLFLTATRLDIARLINWVGSDHPNDVRGNVYEVYTGPHRARLDEYIARGARGELSL